jgi:tRNA/rRNA methyltransferase
MRDFIPPVLAGSLVLPHGVSVTMVEPQGPVNVGHVARLVQNFGVERLYLIKPKADLSVAAMYASHASEVIDRAVVTTLARVREENELLVATTAVRAVKKSNVIRRMVSPERLHDLLASSSSSSLVFGRDTTGLTNDEIGMCDVTTTLDTAPAYRAMNVGHAAAVLLYLASRRGARHERRQGRKAREVFARSLADLSEASRGSGSKTKDIFDVGKRIAVDSAMTDRQLNLLTGVLRKATAAIDKFQDRDSKT